MAVRIRVRQQGRTNHKTYRLVACDVHVKRDGKYLDNLGWYDPFLEGSNAKIDEEKVLYWLSKGAEMSDEAKALIARTAPHVIKQWREKQQAKRVKLAQKRRQAREQAQSKT